jgi:hypothetical protein
VVKTLSTKNKTSLCAGKKNPARNRHGLIQPGQSLRLIFY